MWYVGLDLHWRTSSVCIVNEQGTEVKKATVKGQQWLLGEAQWPNRLAAVEAVMLVAELELFQKQIALVTKELDGRGKDDPRVILLRTIPGVGPRTDEAVVAYVDDPKRFRGSHQVGCYFGLVPRQDQSGNKNRLGHVTKEGPAAVRQLVVEAAWQAIRRSPTAQARFERLGGRDADRRKTALVAVGRWLVCCMHAMLVRGEVWRETAA